MSYKIGDIPGEPVEVTEGVPLVLTPFSTVEAVLYAPDGEPVGDVTPAGTLVPVPGQPGYYILTGADTTGGLVGTIDTEREVVFIEWPAATPFIAEGIYRMSIALVGAGARETLPSIPFVVEPIDDGWHTVSSAKLEWNTQGLDEATLYTALAVAKSQCIVYAPTFTGRPPINYKRAQLSQARNIVNASRVTPSGDLDGGSFALTTHPLDWHVQNLLRPKAAVPIVG